MPKATSSSVGKGTDRSSSGTPGHHGVPGQRSIGITYMVGEFEETEGPYLHKNLAPRHWEGGRSILDPTY